MVMTSNPVVGREGRRYLRKPVPLFFPTDEKVPEHKLHVLLRTALFELVRLGLGDRVMVGTEQFIYYDASDPRRCLAPDLMVWVGAPDEIFGTWKVWERGAPHVAVEIVSPADKPPGPWHKKLERYVQCGIQEVVRFDPVAKQGQLRIWDRVEGDLVERDLRSRSDYLCDALDLYWCLTDDPKLGLMLRLAQDSAGERLLPTPMEAQEQAEARAREAEVQAREAEVQAREAERRVRELEAELARRG